MKNFQTILKQRGYYLGEVDGLVGPITLHAAQRFVTDEIFRRKWVQPKTDIVFLRLDQSLTDTFDDVACLFVGGVLTRLAACSTTAGSHYIKNPITYGGVKGTAIAKEQQIIGGHKFVTAADWKTLWLGGPYFKQVKDIEIYRDGNMDNKLDKVTLQRGNFGINWHRGGLGNIIYNWSAGCMVTPDKQWWEFVKPFSNGQLVNYTLIEV